MPTDIIADVPDLLCRASQCMSAVGDQKLDPEVERRYLKTFGNMWQTRTLDPLRPGDSIDTYYFRRAALHYGGKMLVAATVNGYHAALKRGDAVALSASLARLQIAVDRVQAAFAVDPPAPKGVLPWNLPPSRYSLQQEVDKRIRGSNSKMHSLPDLAPDWTDKVWNAAVELDWQYLDSLAAALIIPLRPEELVPDEGPGTGFSEGVQVRLQTDSRLSLRFVPVKSQNGLYGTGPVTIVVDPTLTGHPGMYLAEQCLKLGGSLIISIESKDAFRKSLVLIGKAALPHSTIRITPYVIRHQLLADLKKTFGKGKKVAASAGHISVRTQNYYAGEDCGRTRAGYISISTERTPRAGRRPAAKATIRKK